MGQIPGGSQRGKRIESAALDEAGVQVFCSGGSAVHLCVRNCEFCVEIEKIRRDKRRRGKNPAVFVYTMTKYRFVLAQESVFGECTSSSF